MDVSNGGNYSKHIYMGSQRIVSKLNNSGGFYFYHPDHPVSSSLITDGTGALTQHIQYVPFGEVFVEERTNSWSTPYKFNGKELDEETGLYYYHARYYDPRLSVWLSVDPLAEKKPWMTSYHYCSNNPVMRIDPDGRIDIDKNNKLKYPKLTTYFKNALSEWMKMSPEFKAHFLQKSGLNDRQVVSMLKFGKGILPIISIENLDSEDKRVNGITYSKSRIAIHEGIADMFESSSVSMVEVFTLLLESTFFHELTHVGNLMTSNSLNGKYDESGKAFEISVYGQDVGRPNALDIINNREPEQIIRSEPIDFDRIYKPIIDN